MSLSLPFIRLVIGTMLMHADLRRFPRAFLVEVVIGYDECVGGSLGVEIMYARMCVWRVGSRILCINTCW